MAPKILVLEDDPESLYLTKTALEGLGFEIKDCATISSADKAFSKNAPDLALLDLGLPDGSGIDLIKRWRARSSVVPVIVLTARNDILTRLEAFKAGAQDYIAKPFSIEELLARVHVHLQLKQSKDDLERKNYDLELMSRARQDMLDMILHDLKTPLSSIKGTLELIKLRGLISDKSYANLLDSAGTAADFMLLMLNDLLDMAQMKQASLPVSMTRLDLKTLAERLETLFAAKLQHHQVELRFTVSDDTRSLVCDKNLIFRILVNLIANALMVSPKAGHIEVTAAFAAGQLRLAVADRGPGVPQKMRLKIFEKFVTSPNEEGRRGIGLAFCQAAAAALKGSIKVEDRPAGGSVFVVKVPARRE